MASTIISSNVRGLSSYTNLDFFHSELMKEPDAIFCIQETGRYERALTNIFHNLKHKYNIHRSSGTTKYSGVAILTPLGICEIEDTVTILEGHVMAQRLIIGKTRLLLINALIPHFDGVAVKSIEDIGGVIGANLSIPCILTGDFNCTLNPSTLR